MSITIPSTPFVLPTTLLTALLLPPPPPILVDSGGTYTLAAGLAGDILVNFGGAVTIALPPAAARGGVPTSIIDRGGFAVAHPITILPSGSETIMGLASITMGSNFGGVTLWPDPAGGWYQK
jgi:hypothetical protein